MKTLSLRTAVGGSYLLLTMVALLLIYGAMQDTNRRVMGDMGYSATREQAADMARTIEHAMDHQAAAIRAYLEQNADLPFLRSALKNGDTAKLREVSLWLGKGQPNLLGVVLIPRNTAMPVAYDNRVSLGFGPVQSMTVPVVHDRWLYGEIKVRIDCAPIVKAIADSIGRKHRLALFGSNGAVLWADPGFGNDKLRGLSRVMGGSAGDVTDGIKLLYGKDPTSWGVAKGKDTGVALGMPDSSRIHLRDMALNILFVTVSIGMLAGFFGFVIAGSMTRSLKETATAAQLMASGGPFRMPTGARIREVDVLSRTIADMMVTIDAQRMELLERYTQLESRSILLERVNRDNQEKAAILTEQRQELEARYGDIAKQSTAIKEQNRQLAILNDQLTRANMRLSAMVDQLREKDEALKKALLSEEAQANAVIEGTADLVIVTDYTGRIIQANPAANSYFKEFGGHMEGKHCSEVISCRGEGGERHCETRTTCPLARARDNNRDQYQEVGHQGVSGARTELGLRWSLVADATSGRPERAVCIMRDVTRQREADRAKSEFVSAVSHELRTPLTSLRGFLYLLSRPDSNVTEEETLEYLHFMEEDIARLSRLVEDVLNVSRIEAGLPLEIRRKPMDLGTLLESAVNPLRMGPNARRVEVRCMPDIVVNGDEDKIRQVVSNLLANAVKFSPPETHIEVSARREGPHASVAIRDFGCGIPREDQGRVFDRFFRGRNVKGRIKGTGLGLHICKAFVDAHNGRIWVESGGAGQGSTFVFTVPLQAEVPVASDKRRREAG